MSAGRPATTRAVCAAPLVFVQRAARGVVRGVAVQLDTRRARWLAALCVVGLFAGLALQHSVSSIDPATEPELSPVPLAPSRCRAHDEQALSLARALEQLAAASWERVPFDPRESPRAVVQIAEAEACFAAAHERTGRLRAAALYYRYSADLERRFARARLLLRIAMRAEARREGARRAVAWPERERQPALGSGAAPAVARQVAELLALLERAPPRAGAYRDDLQRLARRLGGARPLPSSHKEIPVIHDRTQPARVP